MGAGVSDELRLRDIIRPDADLVPFWSAPTAAAEPVTVDEIRAAFEKLAAEGPRACEHVVHPHAQGWTRCASCFQPIEVRREP